MTIQLTVAFRSFGKGVDLQLSGVSGQEHAVQVLHAVAARFLHGSILQTQMLQHAVNGLLSQTFLDVGGHLNTSLLERATGIRC